MNKHKNNKKYSKVLFIIAKGNREIDKYNASNVDLTKISYFPKEEEILFFPFSCFYISKIIKTKDYYEIYLNYFGEFRSYLKERGISSEDILDIEIPKTTYIQNLLNFGLIPKNFIFGNEKVDRKNYKNNQKEEEIKQKLNLKKIEIKKNPINIGNNEDYEISDNDDKKYNNDYKLSYNVNKKYNDDNKISDNNDKKYNNDNKISDNNDKKYNNDNKISDNNDKKYNDDNGISDNDDKKYNDDNGISDNDDKKYNDDNGISDNDDEEYNSFILDLVYMIDVTSSMKNIIRPISEFYIKISKEIKKKLPKYNIKFGSILYSDPVDVPSEENKFYDLTDDIISFQETIKNINVLDGGDEAEDWVGAYSIAINNINWRNGIKIIIHITDAGAHGKMFTQYDKHEAESEKLNYLIKQCAKQNFNIFALYVGENALNSFNVFKKQFHEAGGKTFVINKFGNQDDFLKVVLEIVESVLKKKDN